MRPFLSGAALCALWAVTVFAMTWLYMWRIGWCRMTRPELMPVSPAVAESLRYASILLTIGTDPDDPESWSVDVYRVANPVCALEVARLLRDVIADLEANHGASPCDGPR